MKHDVAASPALPDRALLTIALCLAALVGLTETGLLAIARFGLGRFTHLNPHFAYLAPLWYMVAVLFIIGPLLLMGRRKPPRARLAIAVLPIALTGSLGILFLYGRLSRWAALVLAVGVAIQATRIVSARAALAHRIARAGLPILLFATVAIAVSMNAGRAMSERSALSRIAPDDDKVNVLFIIWDTVRAASLSLYGYERATTPALERLAADGVVFDRAYSVAPWTLPSHASLFTGLQAHELSTDWLKPLDDESVTLAESFSRNGYATGGFVANYFYCSEESGLGRGFQHYEVYPTPSLAQFILGSSVARAFFDSRAVRLALGEKPGRKFAGGVNAEFLDWIDGIDGRPFFAFLNYFDAHHPYLPPAPWDTLFGPLLPGRDPTMREGRSFTPRELQAEIDAYDGSIRSLDDHLAWLIEDLDRRGLLDNTIVVVTSDHGEEFGEHGVFTHGNTLFERSLHVPLLIHYPAGLPRGLRVADWISTSDLAATIASMAGMSAGVGGTSLDRFWASTTPSPVPVLAAAAPDTLLAQVGHSRGHPPNYPITHGDMQSILVRPYQYIRRGDAQEQLFDLTDSASALVDLAGRPESAPALNRLRGYLTRTLAAAGTNANPGSN
ncbi:MAG: sulfatase-like hydrolase/transferase [Longimicrobiales bacterium]